MACGWSVLSCLNVAETETRVRWNTWNVRFSLHGWYPNGFLMPLTADVSEIRRTRHLAHKESRLTVPCRDSKRHLGLCSPSPPRSVNEAGSRIFWAAFATATSKSWRNHGAFKGKVRAEGQADHRKVESRSGSVRGRGSAEWQGETREREGIRSGRGLLQQQARNHSMQTDSIQSSSITHDNAAKEQEQEQDPCPPLQSGSLPRPLTNRAGVRSAC